MSIFIFSRPVRSGKTTELQHCCNEINAVGILMPDIDGSRKIFNIKTKEIFDIECKDPANTKKTLQAVGQYHFYNESFEKANAILMEASASNSGWLIIDETGKLELQSLGLYEATKKIIENKEYHTGYKNLLLVVRDSLYKQVISFFNIPAHTLIHDLNGITLSAVKDPDSGK